MRDVYVILNLNGEVIARYEAFSEYDAGARYEREMKAHGDLCEPYQVMSRRDWVAWRTQPETFRWSTEDEATV